MTGASELKMCEIVTLLLIKVPSHSSIFNISLLYDYISSSYQSFVLAVGSVSYWIFF